MVDTNYFPEEDYDLIQNPAGMVTGVMKNDDIFKELKKINKRLSNKHTPLIPDKSSDILKKVPKRTTQKELARIKKIAKLGKKERSLLDILSDLEPHSLRSLRIDVPTEACSKLKGRLQRKIVIWGFTIDTEKNNGLKIDSFYQLIYSPRTIQASKEVKHK